ncbi:hypothetical protein HMC16_05750 [Corynebacterium sp. zg-915]|uniref:Uncharacterized protein n=2 Tax=Corynebacterium wankanglinii TaxID=2735136 RepID=A0A838CJW4_9CORY|nr:hypothetical protein [Corynebacterium wankanglinii]
MCTSPRFGAADGSVAFSSPGVRGARMKSAALSSVSWARWKLSPAAESVVLAGTVPSPHAWLAVPGNWTATASTSLPELSRSFAL